MKNMNKRMVLCSSVVINKEDMWICGEKKLSLQPLKNKYFINLEIERYAERDFINNW